MSSQSGTGERRVFAHRTGFLGHPARPDVAWNTENLQKLKEIGFNTIQLNIAWGGRPRDEPLNLEDVVDPGGTGLESFQKVRLNSKSDGFERRRTNLAERIRLCRELGLRTLFHFGAPFNNHLRGGDSPPNCVSDPAVREFYCGLIDLLDRQFPGIDDLHLYTYDQDAWLCSEFDICPRCQGVPLHGRVAAFVNALGAAWKRANPDGRLWWEPWELSSGQALKSVGLLDRECVGLALHSNIAEVMATMPVDRWLKNSIMLARERGLPVIVEHFLCGPTEEVEPLEHLFWPLVTWRGLKAIAETGADGVKEYYGINPVGEDPNLRMTELFFANPAMTEDEALRRLAKPYGKAAELAAAFWRKGGEAMELFPWEASWWIRSIGKSNPAHSMDAAVIRGQQAHTPAWESTRRSIFMKTDNATPDPWMIEDVQLRCELAAGRLREAIDLGRQLEALLDGPLKQTIGLQLADLARFLQRAVAYACHLRETNLVDIIRATLQRGDKVPERTVAELEAMLLRDLENQGDSQPLRQAIALLRADVACFVNTCFLHGAKHIFSRGPWSVTSL